MFKTNKIVYYIILIMFKDLESGTIICKYCGLTQNEIDGDFTVICDCRNNQTFIHKECIPLFMKNNNYYCNKCNSNYKIDLYNKFYIRLNNIIQYFQFN